MKEDLGSDKYSLRCEDFIPEYICTPTPAWLGHMVFAGLVMKELRPRIFVELGTFYGNSYFAFCGAALKHKIDVRCYAVDSWKGEVQTGLYDDTVFQTVNSYNEAHFSSFSTLMRGMFDDYVSHFEDGTIDLLHIDGFHSYEAVSHDFQTWIDKVRPGGIVLFHDVVVHQEGFGVCKFWEEVKRQSSEHFTFTHSHGLGVWRKPGGPELKSAILRGLFSSDWEIIDAVHNLALETWSDIYDVLRVKADYVNYQLSSTQEQLSSTQGQLASTQGQLASTQGQLASTRDQLTISQNQLTMSQNQLTISQNQLTISQNQLSSTQDQLTVTKGQLSSTQDQLTLINEELASAKGELGSTKEELASTKEELGSTKGELASTKEELGSTKGELGNMRATETSLRNEINGLRQTVEILRNSFSYLIGHALVLVLKSPLFLARYLAASVGLKRKECDGKTGSPTSPEQASEEPMTSILMPINDTPPRFRDKAIESIRNFCKRVVLAVVPVDSGMYRFLHRIYEKFFLRGRRWVKSHPVKTLVTNLSNRGALHPAQAYIYLHTFTAPAEDYRASVEFPQPPEKPELSIIIPVYNKFHYTSRCLETLCANAPGLSYEVVIADDCSSDETINATHYFKNIRYIRNHENLGFLRSCNNAIRQARGKYIYLLNNDTEVLPETVQTLYETLISDPAVGAVGSRLIYPNKTLQEAGSIVWNDASCLGYGRGDDPFKSEYSFLRDVDFCSGASLMFSRELFLSLGGFDERFAPAYYEEADFCMSLSHIGYRIVYQPDSMLIHHEYASGCSQNSLHLMKMNQKKFYEKWKDDLKLHMQPCPGNIIEARYHDRKPHILIIDDLVPDSRIGSGFPRAEKMLDDLLRLNVHITFLQALDTKENVWEFPVNVIYESRKKYRQAGVEIICCTPSGPLILLADFLKQRQKYFSLAMISRSHNMDEYKKCAVPLDCPIIYDAEAISQLRTVEWLKLNGRKLQPKDIDSLLEPELSLIRDAAMVFSVSPREQDFMRRGGARNVEVLSHELKLASGSDPIPFEERSGILWVGGVLMEDPGVPNYDSLQYFISEIFPKLPKDITFSIVGEINSPKLLNLQTPRIRFLGRIDDIDALFNKSKLFVVPTRFAAGVPLKLYEAAAHGLPSVVTPLIQTQVAWTPGEDLLVGGSPEKFAKQIKRLYYSKDLWETVHKNCIKCFERDCSSERFSSVLYNAFSTFLDGARGEHNIIGTLLPYIIGKSQCLEVGSESLLAEYPNLSNRTDVVNINADIVASGLSKISSQYHFIFLSHYLEKAIDPVGALRSIFSLLQKDGFLAIVGNDASPDSLLHTPASEEDLVARFSGAVSAQDILARRYHACRRSDTSLAQKRVDEMVKRDLETFAVLNHWSLKDVEILLNTGFRLLNCNGSIVCRIPGDLFGGRYIIFVSLNENEMEARREFLQLFCKALYAACPELEKEFPKVSEHIDGMRLLSQLKDSKHTVAGFRQYKDVIQNVVEQFTDNI